MLYIYIYIYIYIYTHLETFFIFRKKFQFLDIQRKSYVQIKCRYSQKISKFIENREFKFQII